MIICSGSGELHNRAIADHIKEKASENKFQTPIIEGYDNGVWILIDFFDIVVHIFTEDKRKYYKIEEIWNLKTIPASEKKENNDKK